MNPTNPTNPMTALIALTRKDIIVFLASRRALFIALLMPCLLGTFFGFLFGGSGNKGGGNIKIEIAVVSQDQSAVAQKIIAGLKADSSLHVADVSLEEARTLVAKGKLNAVIVIPAHFGDAAGAALFGAGDKPEIAIYHDPSQTAVLGMVKGLLTQQVMQAVSAVVFGAARAPGGSQADSSPAPGLVMPYVTRAEAVSSGPAYNGYAHSFAGMAVQFILFMGIDCGVSILLARRMGIWSRYRAAPISMATILGARALSAAIIALAVLAFVYLYAFLVFDVRISGSVIGFLGVALAFAVFTAAFGLLIAALGKTPEAARSFATFGTLILVMLGGAWAPTFIFPQWMQTATLVVPTRWAVEGFELMTWRAQGLHAALQPIAALLAFAVLLGALALWRFQKDSSHG